MKNSVIICEGATDGVLLQYLLERIGGWAYSREKPKLKHSRIGMQKDEWAHLLSKGDDLLTIASAGSNSELIPVFIKALKVVKNAGSDNESFSDIVILTDRDSDDTEKQILENVDEQLRLFNATSEGQLEHNKWKDYSMMTSMGLLCHFRVLILVIPFTEKGALETFLLEAISDDSVKNGDGYDKAIIDKGNAFVDTVDSKKRYLNKRRYITKAKFDVYFCVRTSAEQFTERQNILKNIPWENFKLFQQDLALLEEI